MRMIARHRRLVISAGILLIVSNVGHAADTAELEAKVLEARERFSDRQNLLGIYNLMTETVTALNNLEAERLRKKPMCAT